MAGNLVITLRGALAALANHQRTSRHALNALLGNAFRFAGRPTTAAIHGWADRRDEVTGLIDGLLDTTTDLLTRTSGLNRNDRVVAIHTTLLATPLLTGLAAGCADVRITESTEADALIRHLYCSDLPHLGAHQGIEETAQALRAWSAEALTRTLAAFRDTGLSGHDFPKNFADQVRENYRASYQRFSESVPEFRLWSGLGTRSDPDAMLTRHLTTSTAIRSPLLAVGHPDAAESLVTSVLSARFPEGHMVTRVPLQDVHATVEEQLRDPLDVTDDHYISRHVPGTAHMVLLDDVEDLFATITTNRPTYLDEIVLFQDIAAALNCELAVVIATRALEPNIPSRFPVITLG
ncbi:hypothetical protein [Actinokineospora enzanensis]|uniref:NACHT N-terminal helical domain 7-containing protein n=1 Tax=Actinokineospora enzanensis TaxID=155975 RepID=UPI0004755869|nr:hypothetical protein [Actinokineospora enzanensis]